MTRDIFLFDTETTSEKPETCRVVQVGGVLAKCIEDWNYEHEVIVDEICDPGLEVSAKAAEIHGITPEMIAGKRLDDIVINETYDWIQDNYLKPDGTPAFIIGGHNVKYFDMQLFWRIAARGEIFGLPYIDTLVAAQRLIPLAPTHKLTTPKNEPEKIGLIEALKLGPVEGAHTAVGDAMMVFKLIEYFCTKLKMTPMELAVWCSEPRIFKIMPFGKHKGKLLGRGGGSDTHVPAGYMWWVANNFSPGGDWEVTLKYHYQMNMRLLQSRKNR